MDLFRKCMDPVEKVLKDSKIDKARRQGLKGPGSWIQGPGLPLHGHGSTRTAREGR